MGQGLVTVLESRNRDGTFRIYLLPNFGAMNMGPMRQSSCSTVVQFEQIVPWSLCE